MDIMLYMVLPTAVLYGVTALLLRIRYRSKPMSDIELWATEAKHYGMDLSDYVCSSQFEESREEELAGGRLATLSRIALSVELDRRVRNTGIADSVMFRSR